MPAADRSRLFVLFLGLAAMLGAGCATTQRAWRQPMPRLPATRFLGKMPDVRVVLSGPVTNASLMSLGPVRVYAGQTPADPVGRARLLAISRGPQGFKCNGAVYPVTRLTLLPEPGKVIQFTGFRLRGAVDLVADPKQGSFRVINRLPLEDYLKGVVPNEVGASWPVESLRAQAVAARTFTFSRLDPDPRSLYDLEATTNSQVYRGIDSEHPAASAAVESTRGEIAVFGGKPIAAFYHSNCGGHTADVTDVWGGGQEYLRGVTCDFCRDSNHYRWTCTLSRAQLEQVLSQQWPMSRLMRIEAGPCAPDGRVRSVRLQLDTGFREVKAPVFRQWLGPDRLRSTRFEVQGADDQWIFTGYGWGHGVGLCQEGAKQQASMGMRYDDILNYYYPGAQLQRLDY